MAIDENNGASLSLIQKNQDGQQHEDTNEEPPRKESKMSHHGNDDHAEKSSISTLTNDQDGNSGASRTSTFPVSLLVLAEQAKEDALLRAIINSRHNGTNSSPIKPLHRSSHRPKHLTLFQLLFHQLLQPTSRPLMQ
jgi:hypothetical protein